MKQRQNLAPSKLLAEHRRSPFVHAMYLQDGLLRYPSQRAVSERDDHSISLGPDSLSEGLLSGTVMSRVIWRVLGVSSSPQAPGPRRFRFGGCCVGKTLTRRRFVKKASAHCSNTNSRFANPMREYMCTNAQRSQAKNPANRATRKSATA